MILAIRSGGSNGRVRRSAWPEMLIPTHGSSDSQAFLQSEIGGLRGTSRLVHKAWACPPINYNFPGFAEMLDLLCFTMLFEGF